MFVATQESHTLPEVSCPNCHLKTRADMPYCLHCRYHFLIYSCGFCHQAQACVGQENCVFCKKPTPVLIQLLTKEQRGVIYSLSV